MAKVLNVFSCLSDLPGGLYDFKIIIRKQAVSVQNVFAFSDG